MLFYIILFASAVIVFIEQKKYQDAGYSSSPFVMAAGVVLLWIAVFPYYVLKVKKPLRDSVLEDGGIPQDVISEEAAWILYAVGVALVVVSFFPGLY